MQDNIIQIIPADGWVAVFEEAGDESAQSLVCFAVVEEAGKRAVRPMLANGKQSGRHCAGPLISVRALPRLRRSRHALLAGRLHG